MRQLAGTPAANTAASVRTLDSAKAFRRSAHRDIADKLTLPAASSFHESARFAITAVATRNGRRFSNTAGSHEAVVDYALAIKLVNSNCHARLDTLRELRHNVNYPDDMVEPTPLELTQIAALVDEVIAAAESALIAQKPKKPIPPPPTSKK